MTAWDFALAMYRVNQRGFISTDTTLIICEIEPSSLHREAFVYVFINFIMSYANMTPDSEQRRKI